MTQSLSTLLKDARRAELAREQREASLEGEFSPTFETELLDEQIKDVVWDDDKAYDEFRDNASPEEWDTFVAEQEERLAKENL